MSGIGWWVGAALITAVTITAVNFIRKAKSESPPSVYPQKIEDRLEDAFGSHMYLDTLKLQHVSEWVKQRYPLLNNGANALVLKVTPDALMQLGITKKYDDIGSNYLVIAIVADKKKTMRDSVLIKYGRLDESLEQALAKGDGSLVITS